MRTLKLILTCEHAGNVVPQNYTFLFKNCQELLESHEGWDIGALESFNFLSQLPCAFKIANPLTRLLIDFNRSLHHPKLFSKLSNTLTKEEKSRLVARHYSPYRNEVEARIQKVINKDSKVLHLSVHSFTPSLNGLERKTDLGLLYDPGRKEERYYAKSIRRQFCSLVPVQIRFNYPYLGKSDGLTSYLRTKFSDEFYSGIEIELNQKFFIQPHLAKDKHTLLDSLLHAVAKTLGISFGSGYGCKNVGH